jgi:hypothetical protein
MSAPKLVAVSLFVVVLLASSFVYAQSPGDSSWSTAFSVHGSIFTDQRDRSIFAETLGMGGRLSRHFGRFSAHVLAEHNFWKGQDQNKEWHSGVLNLGVGGSFHFVNGHVRSSISTGLSVLTFDTRMDSLGHGGVFFEGCPIGLRWFPSEKLVLGLDPLSLHLDAPVLESPRLLYLRYRSTFYLEMSL